MTDRIITCSPLNKSTGRFVMSMVFPEKIKLFTIKEVAQACGISRSTLLRMEEDGFLTPHRVDPNTGYRYYDLQNVTAVGQYQRLQEAGLSRKEIADLYYERVDSRKFLEEQRQKLSRLQRFLDEYELRHDRAKAFSISYVTLPAVTCYSTEITASCPEEMATLSFLAHEKCVAEGYRMLGSEPLFGIPQEPFARMEYAGTEHHSTLCIPVVPDPKPGQPLRFFPATEALSILGFGRYSIVPDLWDRLWTDLDARGLEASEPGRFIALVAPYAGAHYKPEDYCYQCVVPIKSRSDSL